MQRSSKQIKTAYVLDAMALRLSYLPFRAMAETTRFIFRYGGVIYEDEART